MNQGRYAVVNIDNAAEVADIIDSAVSIGGALLDDDTRRFSHIVPRRGGSSKLRSRRPKPKPVRPSERNYFET
jgi:hypothetical protein